MPNSNILMAEDLNLPVPGQTSFWSVHDSFRAGLRDEPRNSRSTSKPNGKKSGNDRQNGNAPRRAQEAVQLQVRQLELKQLELQVKLKRRLEEQAKEAKEAFSAKQQQIERLKQHAFLEAREKERGVSLRRNAGGHSGSASPRSPRSPRGSRGSSEAEELSMDSEDREARQVDRAKKIEKEREKIAWRAMQEEQAEKRKAVAREEAAKKEQAARKIQAFRRASAHQRSRAHAFGEARKTEHGRLEKGHSQTPQKAKPKVQPVERAPPVVKVAPDRMRSIPRGRWAHARSDSPRVSPSRSRASTPESRPPSRKREGLHQPTKALQARVVQKFPPQGHGQVASPSASSRSASPKRREKQPEQSQSTGDLPKRGGASPEGYSPRKEGPLDGRPPWLPVHGRSKSQQESGGREWWEIRSRDPSPSPRDFSSGHRMQPKADQWFYTDSKELKSKEVAFGVDGRPGSQDPPETTRPGPRLQQMRQADVQQISPRKDPSPTRCREQESPTKERATVPAQPPQRSQKAWWVDLQGASLPLATSPAGTSPSNVISEPIERSLAAQPTQLPLLPSPSQLVKPQTHIEWPTMLAPMPPDVPNRLGGSHFAERLGLDTSTRSLPSVRVPAEVWEQRMRQADHQLLSLRQARSQSASPSGSPRIRSLSPVRRSPAFGTSDPIIPALKIVQKYSDYFVASPSNTPRSASNTPRSPRSTPRSPRKGSPPNSPGPVDRSEPRTRFAQPQPQLKWATSKKAKAVVYPRSKEVLSWQAAGFQASGSSYRGVRDEAGVRDGWGMLNQKDGTTYAGQWVSGKRHGAGTLMFDGGIFEGQWARGEASGSGIVRFNNGDKFEGQYVSNRKHGFGIYSWADGATEEGQYFSGQKNDWHVWSRGASVWNLRYDGGSLVEALQVKGKKKEKPRSLPYPRSKESKESKEPGRQPSPKAKASVSKVSRPKAKAPTKAKIPLEEADPVNPTLELMEDLQPQRLELPAEEAEKQLSRVLVDRVYQQVALPSEAHQSF